MKIFGMGLMAVFIICVASGARASNACDTLLCMAGQLQGQGGGAACDGPISDYFNIVEYGKHWRVNPGATASARLGFLNSCDAPGTGNWPELINAAYGTNLL